MRFVKKEHPPTHPPIHTPTHTYIHLPIQLSVHTSAHQSIHLSIHPLTYPFIHLAIHPLPTHPSTHPPVMHSSTHPSTHPPTHLPHPFTLPAPRGSRCAWLLWPHQSHLHMPSPVALYLFSLEVTVTTFRVILTQDGLMSKSVTHSLGKDPMCKWVPMMCSGKFVHIVSVCK